MRDRIIKKWVVLGIILLFVGVSVIPSTGIVEKPSKSTIGRAILYVGGDGPGNYTSIQDAVDNASDGDTVFVFDDSSPYYENVVVDKSIKLIGENRDTTVIDAEGSGGDVVYLSGGGATVSGFTIQNCQLITGAEGIDIQSNYNTVMNCRILNNTDGIALWSNGNKISGNIISNSVDAAIYIDGANSNTITGNTISNNQHNGIMFYMSSYNTISDNNISNNGWFGIVAGMSDYNTVSGNDIISNNYDGINLIFCNNNTITGNTIVDNDDGIFLRESCDDNQIFENNIISNNWRGVDLRYSSSNNNVIYHNNIIDNTVNNAYDEGNNIWDDGYPSGGNYWSDYTGEDANGDGIGDTPYPIPGGDSKDRYPFMNESGWLNPPIANFTYSIDELTVTFDGSSSYDSDGEIISYEWDFDDGTYGNGMIVSHTYSAPEIYNVTLTVTDDDDLEDSITKTIEVEWSPEFEKTFIFGRIDNLTIPGNVITFNAVNIRVIKFSPFQILAYKSGELITISKDYFGLVGARFIFALCDSYMG